jgi:hypothetical protein
MIRLVETVKPSFNRISFPPKFHPDDKSSTQLMTFSSYESGPLSSTAALLSANSNRLMIESWFLDGPRGLASTYYDDCSWSVPLESLVSSLPHFRPIGSFILNSKGLKVGSSTHPCSVQWSGLLRIPNASQDASVSFEIGSSAGSCLTLFINDRLCCGTCLNIGFSNNRRYDHRLGHIPCKCTFEGRSFLSSAEFWRLSLYGNSDGSDPTWHFNWLLMNENHEGFQPVKDSEILPVSTWECAVKVFQGRSPTPIFILLAQISFMISFSGWPTSSKCFFRPTQSNVPQNIVVVPSFDLKGQSHLILGIKPRTQFQLLFDCKDEEDNDIHLSSTSSTRVSSVLLSAPRSPLDPIWCCNERDLITSVSQRVHDNAFVSSAVFHAPGSNYVVPAVISAGKFH